MKYLLVIIFAVWLSNPGFSQDTTVNKLASFKIPEKASRIKNSQVNQYRMQKGLPELDSVSDKEITYDIQGITLSIFATHNPTPFDIKSSKSAYDSWGYGLPGYSSELKKINDGEILIINSSLKANRHYTIYITDKTGFRVVFCTIHYTLDETAKATTIMNAFIGRLKFIRS